MEIIETTIEKDGTCEFCNKDKEETCKDIVIIKGNYINTVMCKECLGILYNECFEKQLN